MDDFEIISSDNGGFEVTKCPDTPLDTISMSRVMWAMEKAYIEKHGKRPFESGKDITQLKNWE